MFDELSSRSKSIVNNANKRHVDTAMHVVQRSDRDKEDTEESHRSMIEDRLILLNLRWERKGKSEAQCHCESEVMILPSWDSICWRNAMFDDVVLLAILIECFFFFLSFFYAIGLERGEKTRKEERERIFQGADEGKKKGEKQANDWREWWLTSFCNFCRT